MNNTVDLLVIGGGPAGLMTAKKATELGLKVILVEKSTDPQKVHRACSSQFIMDDGYEKESLKLKDDSIIFRKNKFSVSYNGPLINVKNKYYSSPRGHIIHFALSGQKPFALKFDKQKLLKNLYEECEKSHVDIRLGTIACGGSDNGNSVTINVKDSFKTYSITAQKAVIAEGANAHLCGLMGFNKDRIYFATALVGKYIVDGIKGIEKESWNLFYGKSFFSNPPVIIGPSLLGDDIFEMTISGTSSCRPDSIFENVVKNSPLKKNLQNINMIDKQGCAVKAFTSLKTPYKDNVLVIGDSAAFVEVEVQGALMCGFHAAQAVHEELKGRHGFKKYTEWWKKSFEFNSGEYLRVSQGYALVPTYTDDELDYLFKLAEDKILEGTYSQYKTPKLIWNEILRHKDKISSEKPEIYEKIKKMNTMTLTETFKK